MDRGTGATGRLPALAGAQTCGGVMFRGPSPGDGARLSEYSHVIPLFGSAGPGPAMLDHQIDMRGSGAPSGRARGGGGGRWVLWPLRGGLWGTPRIIAYRR